MLKNLLLRIYSKMCHLFWIELARMVMEIRALVSSHRDFSYIWQLLIIVRLYRFGPNQQGALLTQKSYRYFPKREEQKTKFEKGGQRFYFYGQIEHDQYQKRKMKQFYEYLKDEKLQLPKNPYFTEQKILLVLAGNGFKPKQTYNAIVSQDKWRTANIPPKMSTKVEQILKSGYYYVCGRDYRMRPIIVNNAKLMDFNFLEDYVTATLVASEWIIKNMLLPGQIENWVVIYDLGKMGITEIPVGACKQTMQVLSNNYGGRLYKLYAINVPGAAVFGWKLASTVLDDATVNKIILDSDTNMPDIWKLCDKSQVEQKYGGTQPNRTQFWPPSVPEPVIMTGLYVSDEEYLKRYKEGRLKNNIVDPAVFQT